MTVFYSRFKFRFSLLYRSFSTWEKLIIWQPLVVSGALPILQKLSVFGVFLACIFPYSDWIQRDTEYLSVFSPNAGKYRPEKLQILKLFTQWPRAIAQKSASFIWCIYKKHAWIWMVPTERFPEMDWKNSSNDQKVFGISSIVFEVIRTISSLFIIFRTKTFRAHKNTSQAKTNQQNKIKQTKNNRGNNFSRAEKLLRGSKSFVLVYF